ncbi:uncharacterized protein LOC100893197 [Strongylocentrotus purpuratus]|uniref:NACHT domain-containing protein n=1 Tax=Strongylocentrotus purpuratus TaxID=7668 RepID=A0A7M7PAQ2_STRPU|nr:uncharacterized protein LOC100893197 [Strongylocentrotus purpuratus]
MEPLQEIELISLAEDIGPGKYSKLCNSLGYSYAVSQSHIVKHLNNVNEALVELLIKWNYNQRDGTETRSILASKLRELRLVELGERLSEGKYIPNQQDSHDHEKTPVQTSPGMAAHEGIANDLICKLAEDIETGEQMEALGRTLGFKFAEINRYTETNRIEGRVTCKGTRDMLFDWRQNVKPCNQHPRLKQALIDAKLVMLADTYLRGTPSNPGIYSKTISASLTVQRCREKLENKYRDQLCRIQMKPWDQSDYAEFEDMHTVVTMVKKDASGQDTKKKEILQGSVAEIFSTKVNGRLPARILISAPAGRGKTTAVAKMAYDWVHKEKGSALEHLPLLFVVKFRNTGHLTSIGEAIKSQLLSDVEDLTPEGLESFIRENQGICHIILDGLDEYAGISSSQRISESNIFRVIRLEEFPECRVLVTTRPHLEYFFDQAELPRVYTKMWIEGFSQESSREYIDRFFASNSNPNNSGHDLKIYLDGQPLINELVKTPLFCLMVCHLWSECLLDSDTTTQTELLDSVNVFLAHHANTRSKSRVKITPDELREIISHLGKVALTGLLDDAKKLVFTHHDFRRAPAILDRACELGIVSKTTVSVTGLPQPNETTFNTIEFYHKLAQEHSAGKYLAAKTKKYMLRLKISKLDRLLQKIKANIGDYENLIRFAAGTDNRLCIRIMEALLSNSFLDESERYRILLDCSSETSGTEGNVSSLVQRCVNARSIVLKSPTVYTVVGMQNLPKQLKREVTTLKFEGSTLSIDVTSGLWSCLRSFTSLIQLSISDSSLSFPTSPPELPSITELSAERVTSQSYEGLLSSLPGLKRVDITIGDEQRENISQIQISLRRHLTEQDLTRINPHSFPPEGNVLSMSRQKMRGLGFLITECQAILSGVAFGLGGALIDVVQSSTRLMSSSLYFEQFSRTLKSDELALNIDTLKIKDCQLSTEMTDKLWSCLRSFTSLTQLSISDSSLSFHPSHPELLSVTKLSAERVTSQSFEGVLSSVPGVRDIDVSIGVAETSNTFQITTASTSRPIGQTGITDEQSFVHIRLHAWPALTTDMNIDSGESNGGLSLLFRDQTKEQQRLHVSGMKGRDEEALVDLFVRTQQLTSLNSGSGCGSLSDTDAIQNTRLNIQQCQLSTKMTEKLWSYLRSLTSLNQLSISDSSLSFPPSPPDLPSVTKLSAERVTSQSYEGLLSSLPGLEEVDITIGDANAEDISQIRTSLRRYMTGQELTCNNLNSSTSEGGVSSMSRKRIRGLGLLIAEGQAMMSGVVFGPKETVIDLVQSSTRLMSASMYAEQFSKSLNSDQDALPIKIWTIKDCQLSTEMTVKLWSCLRSFTSLKHLSISDSSFSFPASPSELPSVTKLSAERLTSQNYTGLLSSLPCLKEVDFTIGYANTEDISQIETSLRRHLTGQDLTRIDPQSITSEGNVSSKSIKRMRGLGLVITECQAILSGVVFGPKETVINLVQSLTRLMSASLYVEQIPMYLDSDKNIKIWTIKDCQLSTEMTVKLWSCLRSFTSLKHLSISDSSFSFPSSPSELPSVTKLSAERLTSQSYTGLLSSLPRLRAIDITIDDAERDIPQINAGLRRTRGQPLKHIRLKALSSLPSEKKSASRETMRGLGLLIEEQTKNLQRLHLAGVESLDEESLVDLIECCRRVKTVSDVWFYLCGTKKGGKLESHLKGLHTSPRGDLNVHVYHDGNFQDDKSYIITHTR